MDDLEKSVVYFDNMCFEEGSQRKTDQKLYITINCIQNVIGMCSSFNIYIKIKGIHRIYTCMPNIGISIFIGSDINDRNVMCLNYEWLCLLYIQIHQKMIFTLKKIIT